MPQICKTVTSWATENISEPVEKWISQQQTKCSKWPWPLNWICKVVMVLVKIIVWVTKTITKLVFTVVCTVVALVLGVILWVFALIIDVFCHKCSAVAWVQYWFLTQGKIKYKSQAPSPNTPGHFDYVFDCGCKKSGGPEITVTAINDDDAAAKAKELCGKLC